MPFTTESPRDEEATQVRPWLELLTQGIFSARTLAEVPRSWLVDRHWMERVEASRQKHGTTWLHELHLGVGAAERFDTTRAMAHFNASVSLRESAVAFRNLATMSQQPTARAAFYQKAWAAALAETDDAMLELQQRSLAGEIAQFWQHNRSWDELGRFVSRLGDARGCKIRYCNNDLVAFAVLR